MAFYNDIYRGGAHSSDHMLGVTEMRLWLLRQEFVGQSLRLVCAGYSSELNHARVR